ncbi:hypothetical protein Bxe_C0439 [Paraburkholderia xenovorans LB400]|uniref:Uncharacterized protein n=1 Tax=Paraburkholderia xenovorans (strain LB400) TaxID=266265 RepID=Q13HU6_PARXL|nr:hypothetical protein Bxe_C0439 [Paraburkholderia xenovorans LB400]
MQNDTSGVDVLVVASRRVPDQAEHGLEFAPAVFAHILLVDRCLHGQHKRPGHGRRVAGRVAHDAMLNGTLSLFTARQHD